MINHLRKLVVHPFLFAIYPPLFLLVNNLHELKLINGLRAILLSLLFATLLFFLLRLITRNTQRSALITSFTFILFFSYGPIHSLIPAYRVFGSLLTNQRFMLIFWGLIFILMIWLLGWKLANSAGLNTFMNFAGILLIVIVLFQAVLYSTQKKSNQTALLNVQTVTSLLDPPPVDQRPDIYYIVLDSYSSSAVLKNEYNIDNSSFINELEKRGFYVAECSHSNYPVTAYSLASSLDLDYIPPVGENLLPNLTGQIQFAPYLWSNTVRATLKELGYITITFNNYYPWHNITDADVYITPPGNTSIPFIQILGLFVGGTNDYEKMLMDMTPLVGWPELLKLLHISPQGSSPTPDSQSGSITMTNNIGEQKFFYDLYKYDLEQLASIPSTPGKKFIYAHFLTTHHPFLFSADGAFTPSQSISGYASSIQYTDKMILDAVDQIITKSNPQPVIIIQGDHALAKSKDKFGILNAYYLPGINQNTLYPTISPVNSFRVVFNQFFGANLSLLPDQSFLFQEEKGKLVPEIQKIDSDCGK